MEKKATEEISAMAANQNESAAPAKRRGRPVGSKNRSKKTPKSNTGKIRKTDSAMAANQNESAAPAKRRGRPVGSKNRSKKTPKSDTGVIKTKKTDNTMAANQNESAAPAKRRGRPVGSKNMAKKTPKSLDAGAINVKRKRGRPPGGTSKPEELSLLGSNPKTLSMDLNDIQSLIGFVSKSGVSEVNLETESVKLVIKTTGSSSFVASAPVAVQQPVVMPVQVTSPAVTVPSAPPVADESRYITIKSPMIGTFYRRPSPDKPLFVNVGDDIKPGKVLCIIEAMKLFNEIESEVSGKLVKILVDDASPVEYDQPLFLVDPS